MDSPSSSTRPVLAVVVALLLLPFALLLAVPAIAAGTPAATDSICGPGGTGQSVADVTLDAEQLANAATITAVTQGRGLPPYAATIALATAYQESSLHNITAAVDHDSLGLFQQRVIYYTAAVAADPVKATNAFLDRLVVQPNWQTRPLTDVAADIQQPLTAYRGRYAQWQPLAAQLTTRLWTGTATPSSPAATGTPGTSTAGGTAPAAPCAGSVGTRLHPGRPHRRPGPDPRLDGTPTNPGHVGMVAGIDTAGAVWLVEAARTGIPIRLTPIAGWIGEIVTIRRIG